MPTNHTTQTECTALSSRLTKLALEAHDLCVQLEAKDISPWETELYLDLPAGLLQLVLDELYWAIDRAWGTPNERAKYLESSRILATVIPADRWLRAKDLSGASAPAASIAAGS